MRFIVARKLKEAVGMKLRGFSFSYSRQMLLVWEDGTYSLIEGDFAPEDGVGIYELTGRLEMGEYGLHNVVSSTLITEEEVAEWEQALKARDAEQIRQRELAEYRRLKKKFATVEHDPKLLS